LHGLAGKLEGVFAVHIAHSYRITLSFAKPEEKKGPKIKTRKDGDKTEEPPMEVILLYLGSHDEVYR
jgi:hypothetical protein